MSVLSTTLDATSSGLGTEDSPNNFAREKHHCHCEEFDDVAIVPRLDATSQFGGDDVGRNDNVIHVAYDCHVVELLAMTVTATQALESSDCHPARC